MKHISELLYLRWRIKKIKAEAESIIGKPAKSKPKIYHNGAQKFHRIYFEMKKRNISFLDEL